MLVHFYLKFAIPKMGSWRIGELAVSSMLLKPSTHIDENRELTIGLSQICFQRGTHMS